MTPGGGWDRPRAPPPSTASNYYVWEEVASKYWGWKGPQGEVAGAGDRPGAALGVLPLSTAEGGATRRREGWLAPSTVFKYCGWRGEGGATGPGIGLGPLSKYCSRYCGWGGHQRRRAGRWIGGGRGALQVLPLKYYVNGSRGVSANNTALRFSISITSYPFPARRPAAAPAPGLAPALAPRPPPRPGVAADPPRPAPRRRPAGPEPRVGGPARIRPIGLPPRAQSRPACSCPLSGLLTA